MEEAVAEDLLRVRVEQPRGHVCRIDPGSHQGGVIGDFDAVDVLEGQHAARRVAPQDARHAHLSVSGKVRCEGLGVLALGEVVGLLLQNARELAQQRWHVGAAPDRRAGRKTTR